MGALQSCNESKRLISSDCMRDDLSGRFKGNKMRNRSGGRGAAERAVFKIGMRARLMMMMMPWHHHYRR